MHTCGNKECGSALHGVQFPSDTQRAIKSKLQTQETLDVLSPLKTAQSLLLLKFSRKKNILYIHMKLCINLQQQAAE